jgi:lipoate-protein ligase A
MKTIINSSTDPFYNLALEEYLLKYFQSNEEVFYLWRNSPSIIVGRNQNVFEEVDLREVEKAGIPIIRRISGGGAVYHDLGNLNFSFLVPYLKENLNNYQKFTEPIIRVLRKNVIPAEFYGKSDIRIGDKKISGNAQSFYQKRMIHHGTLLFDTDLDKLESFLKINDNYQSKSIRSNPSKTVNLKEYLPEDFKITDLYISLVEEIVGNLKNKLLKLTPDDIQKVKELRDQKYQTYEWNYGESPEFTLSREEPFFLKLNVKEGRIFNLDLNFPTITLDKNLEMKNSLIGHRFIEREIKEILLNLSMEENLKLKFLDNVFK